MRSSSFAMDPARSSVSLARSLGLRLVAEGVETRSDWDQVQKLGVEVAQGYALSRPQCSLHFAQWLADWSEIAQPGDGRPLTGLLWPGGPEPTCPSCDAVGASWRLPATLEDVA